MIQCAIYDVQHNWAPNKQRENQASVQTWIVGPSPDPGIKLIQPPKASLWEWEIPELNGYLDVGNQWETWGKSSKFLLRNSPANHNWLPESNQRISMRVNGIIQGKL